MTGKTLGMATNSVVSAQGMKASCQHPWPSVSSSAKWAQDLYLDPPRGLCGGQPCSGGAQSGLEPERQTGLRAGVRLLIVHDLQTWPGSQTAA